MLKAKEFAEGLETFGDELRPIVCQEVGRGSVGHYSMIKENGGDMQRSGGRRWDGLRQFRIAMRHYDDISTTYSCLRERTENVHGHEFKRCTGKEQLEVACLRRSCTNTGANATILDRGVCIARNV